MTKYQDYHEKEEFTGMNNKQLLDRNNQQIKNQDKKIEELTGVAKMGDKTAKALGENLQNQNVKLDKLGSDIDKAEVQMEKTRSKFEDFIENGSFCCLYIIIIVLLAVLTLVIIFV